MKAMIPHHSIAIMTNERAHIRDPKVRLLADRIIDAQVCEIGEMERLIARLEAHPVPGAAPGFPSYRARAIPPPLLKLIGISSLSATTASRNVSSRTAWRSATSCSVTHRFGASVW